MSEEMLEDEIPIARVIEHENNKSKLESPDIINIIKQGNLDNVNVGKYSNDIIETEEHIDDIIEKTDNESQEIVDVIEKKNNENTEEHINKNNDVDEVFKRTGMSKEMQDEVRKMLLDVQNTYEAAYSKKEQELESKKIKEIEDYKRKLENDKMSTLNAEQQERYKRELKTAADQQKIDFLSNRVKELESHIHDIENQKFISEKITSCPAVKPFIEKMNIKTKEDYETKIEPIITNIMEYDDFKKNNKNGNSNAFKGYGRQSKLNSNKNTNFVDNSYKKAFLDKAIMK